MICFDPEDEQSSPKSLERCRRKIRRSSRVEPADSILTSFRCRSSSAACGARHLLQHRAAPDPSCAVLVLPCSDVPPPLRGARSSLYGMRHPTFSNAASGLPCATLGLLGVRRSTSPLRLLEDFSTSFTASPSQPTRTTLDELSDSGLVPVHMFDSTCVYLYMHAYKGVRG